jgi:hypothetical protein
MKKLATRAVRVALTIAILVGLVLFARKVNWTSTWHSITEANRTILVLAAIVNALSLIGKAIRWWIFLRPVGASSFWLALKATFAGAGLNNILVANGGEAARVVFVARAAHVPSAKVLATLALERMFELIGYIVMLALASRTRRSGCGGDRRRMARENGRLHQALRPHHRRNLDRSALRRRSRAIGWDLGASSVDLQPHRAVRRLQHLARRDGGGDSRRESRLCRSRDAR